MNFNNTRYVKVLHVSQLCIAAAAAAAYHPLKHHSWLTCMLGRPPAAVLCGPHSPQAAPQGRHAHADGGGGGGGEGGRREGGREGGSGRKGLGCTQAGRQGCGEGRGTLTGTQGEQEA